MEASVDERRVRDIVGLGVEQISGVLRDEIRRPKTRDQARVLTFGTALGIMVVAALAIAALWPYPLACALVLTALAFLKHRLFPIKYEFAWYLIVALFGSFAEGVIIFGGAWSYSSPQFLNIPIWLHAIWGLTGISLITLYSAFSGQS